MRVNILEGIRRIFIVFVAIGLSAVFYFALTQQSSIKKTIVIDGSACANAATDIREIFDRTIMLNFCADKAILLDNKIDSSQKPWNKYSESLDGSENERLHLEEVTPEKQAELEKLWGEAVPELVISDYKLTQVDLDDIQSLIQAQKKENFFNAFIYSLAFLLSAIILYLITRFIVNGFKKST